MDTSESQEAAGVHREGVGSCEKNSAAPDSLKPDDREEFEGLLQALTLERSDIEEGMMFALEHAESAKEVANILTDALTVSDTPVTMKVARLFLMSDILHNCAHQ